MSHGDKRQDRLRWNRRKVLGLGAAVVPATLSGCLGGGDEQPDTPGQAEDGDADTETATHEPSGAGKQGGTLRWGGSVPVQGLDPHIVTAAASWRVFDSITEGLFKVDWNYELQPYLAESLEVSDDNTEFTFNIRQGVKFHNGKELTANDVLASFTRIQNRDLLAGGYFDWVDSMSVTDDYTFVMSLSRPFAPLLNRMSTNSMHILTEEQAQEDRIKEPIGTGPFKFESREVDTNFVLTRHDEYWQEGLPYLDEIRKLEIADDDVRLNKFRAGEVDFINDVAPKDIESMQNDDTVRFSNGRGVPKLLAYLGMNATQEPFDDMHARLALDYTIDKEEVLEAALFGHGQTTATPGFPGSPWETPDIEPRPQDFDMAKDHLDQSAYSDGFTASFKIPSAYAPTVPASEIISSSASDIGITLNIQKVTWSTWLDQVYSKSNFQATISTYLGFWYPDFSYYRFLHPEGAFFYTGWVDDDYNKLVEDAKHILDIDERAAKYHEANHIAEERRSGHLLLWFQNYALASVPEYKGPMGAPDGVTLQFLDNWFDR